MSDGQPTDAEVIRRCRSGEVERFSLLVERYQDRVYHLSLRLLDHPDDALDAAQETFVRAFRSLSQFDEQRPFAPWLVRIATNTCISMLRKRKAGIVSLDAMEEWEADAVLATPAAGSREGDPQRWLERAVRDEEIQRAVLALAEPYRAVVLLRYMEDLPYEAIASALEVPLGTVKTWLYRAHQRLRAVLAEQPAISWKHGDSETRRSNGEG